VSFTYVESWKAIELANQIFGFNGWSSAVVDITPDYVRARVSLSHVLSCPREAFEGAHLVEVAVVVYRLSNRARVGIRSASPPW
jgi:recombination DNA repair RAD52 pathway protein